MKKISLLFFFSFFLAGTVRGIAGVGLVEWPEGFNVVKIQPSQEGSLRMAIFRRAEMPGPRPLIVSLNMWDGEFDSEPFLDEIVARDYHYIHPGQHQPALGAEEDSLRGVISDIENVIRHAMVYAEVNPSEIHVIGSSRYQDVPLGIAGSIWFQMVRGFNFWNEAVSPDQTEPLVSTYRYWYEFKVSENIFNYLPDDLSFLHIQEKNIFLRLKILAIGDSNAANEEGWTYQLHNNLPGSKIYKLARSGLTIGFDNNGREDLNALKNIDAYLREAAENIGESTYDYILLSLGSNDAKADFDGREDEVVTNFRKLLGKIRADGTITDGDTKFVFITPPPMGTEDMEEKYAGGNERLGRLVPRLAETAREAGFDVIDVYHPLQGVFRSYAPDGVHMEPEGQRIIADRIARMIGFWEEGR